MNTLDDTSFSWGTRRVVVDGIFVGPTPPERQRLGVERDEIEIALDVSMMVGGHKTRLVACIESEDNYVALLVGEVAGGSDVPIRVVDEEALLIMASRSVLPAEILVGIPVGFTGSGRRRNPEKVLTRQLCCGGPIRDILDMAGVHSVTVDLIAPAA